MQYTHVVWDFNGTILDDIDASIRSANRLLSLKGLSSFRSVDEYRQKFGFPIIEYYRRLGFDFEEESYDSLAQKFIDFYNEESINCQIYCGIEDVLKYISDKGINQIILSATEKNMLLQQLKALGISEYFDTVLGLDNIYAYSKSDLGVKWRAEIKRLQADAKILMIGDTTHDCATATAMNVDCILVSWGHEDYERLSSCGEKVVNEPNELKNIIKNKQ